MLRHLVCTSSPFPRPLGVGEENRREKGLKIIHVHDTVTSGRENGLKPTRIYDYDVTSGL